MLAHIYIPLKVLINPIHDGKRKLNCPIIFVLNFFVLFEDTGHDTHLVHSLCAILGKVIFTI